MAGTKISELDPATAVANDQQFAVNDAGTSKSLTADLLLTPKVTGSPGSPYLASAGTLPISDAPHEIIVLAGNGGPVTLAGTPLIAAPSKAGRRLTLIGTSNTDTVTLPGTGSDVIQNGPCVLRLGSSITFISTGTTTYVEECRNDK